MSPTTEPAGAADPRAWFDRWVATYDQELRSAGLIDVDCFFRSWRFAVMAGWAPGDSSPDTRAASG